MRTGILPTTLVIAFVVLAGCAPKRIVILMPDQDRQVGKASVITQGGRRQLEKPGDMTSVTARAASPSPVTTADNTFIAAVFTGALAAEPAPPEKFFLFFKTGTTVLDAKSKSAVSRIVAAIKKSGAISITISGYTDSTGPNAFNDALARNRADSIRNRLTRGGLSPDRMIVTSYGKRNPMIPTADGVAEPRNRRVEVIVH